MALPFSDKFESSWHELYGVTDEVSAEAKLGWLRERIAAAPNVIVGSFLPSILLRLCGIPRR